MIGEIFLRKTDAERLLDYDGVMAAKGLLEALYASHGIQELQESEIWLIDHNLEELALPSDARNVLDNPRLTDREISWVQKAQRYAKVASEIMGFGPSAYLRLQVFQPGNQGQQRQIFEDMKSDLNCGAADMPSNWTYPYYVASGKIALIS
jgi:hypothetical protein